MRVRGLARRQNQALHLLADSGALRLSPGKKEGQCYLAGPEGGPSSSVLIFDIESGRWRDKKVKGEGRGFFAAMRRLGIGLDVATAALVTAATKEKEERK